MADQENSKPAANSEWKEVEEWGIDFDPPAKTSRAMTTPVGQIVVAGDVAVPTELELPKLDFSAGEGFVRRWRTGALKKQAAIEGTKQVIATQLKVLGTWLDRVVMAEDARAENACGNAWGLSTVNVFGSCVNWGCPMFLKPSSL